MYDKEIRRIVFARLSLKLTVTYDTVIEMLISRHGGTVDDYTSELDEFITQELAENDQ